ncbi:acyl-CoA dehydrogenase [Leucobacter denitrificans]|uniref:Acyl-CoA dehydrogenase n=1 Tax=Leucobacter denitrificans TaxID=683042 RepID=A0A7G9S541_9MICO|nr:acyl-CoA dehydrogenase [Leucobacter denitrificans]QNN62966.1 acyl-CoA dehydrogenase [Leucobacter denitrificans]
MALPITEEHQDLAESVRALLGAEDALATVRATYDGDYSGLERLWPRFGEQFLLGLHVPEEDGGEGFTLAETAVVLEELGRALSGSGVAASVTVTEALVTHGTAEVKEKFLSKLASGELRVGLGLSANLSVDSQGLSGTTGPVIGGASGDVVALVNGDDLVLLAPTEAAVALNPIENSLDPSLQLGEAELSLKSDQTTVVEGAGRTARYVARLAFSAEAIGASSAVLEQALEYSKVREQFGRTIGSFQAIKHHLANMLVANEQAIAAVWDAARTKPDNTQFTVATDVAVTQALQAFIENAQQNVQIHGGIGFTWEHNAHLYMRRARAIAALVAPEREVLDDIYVWADGGNTRKYGIDLPEEAEEYRVQAREFRKEFDALSGDAQRKFWADSGYMFPHYPKPYGRGADPVEQLVIEEELGDMQLPNMGITWVMITLIQQATQEQVDRWVTPTLYGEYVWCQLFSEPGAGSDAAAVSTRAVKVDGGWRLTGQKVWTSGAQNSNRGLITVRTDPSAPKHKGITTMVVDMQAEGVDIRPLREMSGDALFNEVFFDDVFVPDSDVVGTVNDGWKVARATLGNERVSIGAGNSASFEAGDLPALISQVNLQNDNAVTQAAAKMLVEEHTMRLLNLRSVARAVQASGPGVEGNIGKLISAEHSQGVTELGMTIAGEAGVTGKFPELSYEYLFARCYSIAGGTSEVTRNVIAERILGLPRDPLNK